MNLKGKELESLVLFRSSKLEEQKILTLGRYGTTVVMMNDEKGVPRWQPIPSLPDLEGVIFGTGQQLILECKVCSQASYPIAGTNNKHPKQLAHMLRRAEFGALCFLLIHFNPRDLKTKSDPAMTIAIPVRREDFLWRMHLANEVRTLSRDEARNYGTEIPWNEWSSRATKLTPDLTYLLPEKPAFSLK